MSEQLPEKKIVENVGSSEPIDGIFQEVYDQLRSIAAAKLRHEPSGLTIQPTALVHEAYLRLSRESVPTAWESPNHFIAVAAEVMRRILVDNARRRKRIKRGGEYHRVQVELETLGADLDQDLLIELDHALEELATEDPVKARLVVMRYFGGMTIEEACEVLDISRTTAHRHWTYARAWLFRRIGSQV